MLSPTYWAWLQASILYLGPFEPNSIPGPAGWLPRLLRSGRVRDRPPASPDSVRGNPDQGHLYDRSYGQIATPDTEASQQVVGGVGQDRTGGVRVFADQPEPERDDEDGQGGDREPVLGVDGGEGKRRRDEPDP